MFEVWTLFCGDHRSYLFGNRFHSWSDSREDVGGDEMSFLTDRPLGLTGVVGRGSRRTPRLDLHWLRARSRVGGKDNKPELKLGAAGVWGAGTRSRRE